MQLEYMHPQKLGPQEQFSTLPQSQSGIAGIWPPWHGAQLTVTISCVVNGMKGVGGAGLGAGLSG
jgi:hypothetical protein